MDMEMIKLPYEMSLIVGISDKCNLSCIYCPQNNIVYGLDVVRKKKSSYSNFLTYSDFVECINNIDIKLDELNFAGFGEPSLNPEFVDIIEYCVVKRIVCKTVYIYTNGTTFNKELRDRLINVFLRVNRSVKVIFVFSVGAYTQENYEKLKNRDYFNEVVNNIRDFYKELNRNSLLSNVFCSVQIIAVEENKEFIQGFVDYWTIFFKENNINVCYETYAGEKMSEKNPAGIDIIEALIPDQKKSNTIFNSIISNLDGFEKITNNKSIVYEDHISKTDNINRKPCSALWKQPFLSSSGNIVMCCRDIEQSGIYGSLKNNLLSELYYGENAENIRKSHITGRFDKPYLCLDCSGFEMKTLEDNEFEEHFKKTGNSLLFDIYVKRMNNNYILNFSQILFEDEQCEIKEDKNITFPIYTSNTNIDKQYIKKIPELLIPFEESDITLLPCRFWFDFLKVKKNGVYTGCRCVDIDIDDVMANASDIFKGDYSKLPLKCRECIYRIKPTTDIFLRFRTHVCEFWQDMLYLKEFLSRKIPDLNISDFNTIISGETVKFRITAIDLIMKNSESYENTLTLTNIYKDCRDPYINLLLARNLLYFENDIKAFDLIKKVLKSNENYYFKNIYSILSSIVTNEKMGVDIFSNSTHFEKEFELTGALRYCAWKKGLII